MEININKLKEYGIIPQNFEEIAKQKFDEFDKNRNGYLEYEECAELIMEVARFMKYESFFKNDGAKRRLFENFDSNGDKKFGFDEFKEKLAIQFINHYEELNA